MAKCEWDMLSDIFQEAIDKNGMSKEHVEEMINRCVNEVRDEKMAVSKAILPCLSAEAGEILMADIESTGIRQDVLDRSKMILERLVNERKNNSFKEMAVPFSSIPVVKGESAKQMLEDAKTPLLTEEFLDKCKRESEKYFVKKY